MSFEIEGKLHKIYDTEKKTDSFQAREFVLLVEDGQYPNYIKFQVVQDRVTMLDNLAEGSAVKVYFDLRGREWQGKYFTNLQAWRIEAVGQESRPRPTATDFPDVPPAAAGRDDAASYDDLPF